LHAEFYRKMVLNVIIYQEDTDFTAVFIKILLPRVLIVLAYNLKSSLQMIIEESFCALYNNSFVINFLAFSYYNKITYFN